MTKQDLSLLREHGLEAAPLYTISYSDSDKVDEGPLYVPASQVLKLLRDAPVVLAQEFKESGLTDEHGYGWCAWEKSTRWTGETHTALLVGIKPIVPKTIEQKILEILADHSKSSAQALADIRYIVESSNGER